MPNKDDTPYTGEARLVPEDNRWHLKKEVNLTIIISVIGIAIACVTAYADLKRDIALIKADALVLHQRDTAQSNATDRALDTIRMQYDRLDAKMDRVIERGSKP